MIANFFNKTKPISTLFIIGLLSFIYVFSVTFNVNEELTLYSFAVRLAYFILLLIILFTVNFIVRKNNLAKDNSYPILLFVILIGMFPFSVLNFEILLVNLILLFAYRRIYSLRTKKETQKKLFDSAFWIGIATIIYPWSAVSMLLIYLAIPIFDKSTLRNVLIPIVGFLAPIVIYVSYMYAANDLDILYENLSFEYSTSFRAFNSIKLLVPLALICSLCIWAIFPTTYKITTINNEFRSSWNLLVFHFIISIILVLPWPFKNGAELFFLFFPIAVIFTNYLQIIEEKWFKDVFIYTLLAVIILVYVL
jgi:hypothetical protein